jgi:hypothetical protein
MAELENQQLVPQENAEVNIESMISAPLIAASKANADMVLGQAQFILRNCFNKNADGSYDPIMIKMSLTKSFIDTNKDESDPDYFTVQKLDFSLPILCIIPINSLVVDKVTVDFDMEITSASTWESKAEDGRVLKKPVQLSGKITSGSSDNGKSQYKSQSSSRLKVNINAGPLPLPVGILAILDLYTKTMQPLPTQKTDKT